MQYGAVECSNTGLQLSISLNRVGNTLLEWTNNNPSEYPLTWTCRRPKPHLSIKRLHSAFRAQSGHRLQTGNINFFNPPPFLPSSNFGTILKPEQLFTLIFTTSYIIYYIWTKIHLLWRPDKHHLNLHEIIM